MIYVTSSDTRSDASESRKNDSKRKCAAFSCVTEVSSYHHNDSWTLVTLGDEV
jgi:hypothetical protein